MHEALLFKGICAKSCEAALLSYFPALRNPCQMAKALYLPSAILLLMLCGTIAGIDAFVEVDLCGSDRQGCLHLFLPFELGIPSRHNVP